MKHTSSTTLLAETLGVIRCDSDPSQSDSAQGHFRHSRREASALGVWHLRQMVREFYLGSVWSFGESSNNSFFVVTVSYLSLSITIHVHLSIPYLHSDWDMLAKLKHLKGLLSEVMSLGVIFQAVFLGGITQEPPLHRSLGGCWLGRGMWRVSLSAILFHDDIMV